MGLTEVRDMTAGTVISVYITPETPCSTTPESVARQ